MSPLSAASLDTVPVSFASVSLSSHPSHSLPDKINALSAAGFTGMELGFPDLVSYASSRESREVAEDDYKTLQKAATKIGELCNESGIEIMLLQPFANFEAWPTNSKERSDAFDRLEGWISIMEACGCKTLQVGSTDTPGEKLARGKDGKVDRSAVVKDLQELAGLLETKGFRVAYENWCWSTHAPDWRDVWEIVKEVDRPNIGLCLDTFQSGGGEWADPREESGKVQVHGGDDALDQRWKKSLEALSKDIPADKIFILQISDGYKLDKPIKDDDEDGLRPRGRWSHDYRPLPYQGYLPVVDFSKAVLKTGFRGWFSYEVFDHPPWKKGIVMIDEFAKQAMETQKRLMKDCVEE